MIQSTVDIPTVDGLMNTCVVQPSTPGAHPVVLFYMDGYGLRQELVEMAHRIAAEGYFVVLPNLYYRRSATFHLESETKSAYAELMGHMRSLTSTTTEVDTRAMLTYLETNAAADLRRIGAVGYCMGGRFVIWAAAKHPTRISAIASIHGAEFVSSKSDSPHKVAGLLQCESYFACATEDNWAPPSSIAKLEEGLKASGSAYEIEWYESAGHGFVFPSRGYAYNKQAAEHHWRRLLELFGRTLSGTP